MTAFQSSKGFGSIASVSGPTRLVRSVSDIQTALNDGPGKVIVQAGGTDDRRGHGGALIFPSSHTMLVADPACGGVIVRGTCQTVGQDLTDIICRNLTFAPGINDLPASATDALTGGSGQNHTGAGRFLFDYCRFLFSRDECIGFGFNLSDVTVMRSIVAWGLRNAGHPDGEHSKAIMNAHTGVFRATYYLCALLNCNDRNIRCINDGDIEIINCLAVNYGVGTHLADGAMGTPTRLHFIGNTYLPGPNTPAGAKALVGDRNSVRAKVYVRDNRGPGRENGTGDEWFITNLPTSKRALEPMFTSLIPDSAIRPSSAITLDLLNEIGPKTQDFLTMTLLAQGANGSWIDSPDEVGGYPTPLSLTLIDSDSDGIPDVYEATFTMVDDYLEASLTGTLPPPDVEPPQIQIMLPKANAKVKSNTLMIAGTVSDNVKVERIEIKARGILIQTISEPFGINWSFSWGIPKDFTNGECFIQAQAFDSSDNSNISIVRTVLQRPGHAVQV